MIEENGVRPGMEDNLDVIQNFERLQMKEHVRQLLLLYIEDAAKNSGPLYNLFRNVSIFGWSQKSESVLCDIKNDLSISLIFSMYDKNRPAYIYTDASGIGPGADVE